MIGDAVLGEDVSLWFGTVVRSDAHRIGIGAGSVVTPGKQFPPRSLIMGTPAKMVRVVSESQIQEMQASWRRYVALKNEYCQARVGDCL